MAGKGKSILQDSFEQVVEMGQSTTKKTVKQIAQTASPVKILEQIARDSSIDGNLKDRSEKTGNKNHSPVEFDKLNGKYKQQDEQKEAALRARLFQLSRREEDELLLKNKQKKQQKEQQELQEEQDKKKKENEKNQMQDQGGLPHGKQRRSIFSPKKKADEQHMETRPSTGKQ